ncbi:MAG: hypothetical protein ACTSRT_19955 [Promethearchaeota archaeon]
MKLLCDVLERDFEAIVMCLNVILKQYCTHPGIKGFNEKHGRTCNFNTFKSQTKV